MENPSSSSSDSDYIESDHETTSNSEIGSDSSVTLLGQLLSDIELTDEDSDADPLWKPSQSDAVAVLCLAFSCFYFLTPDLFIPLSY